MNKKYEKPELTIVNIEYDKQLLAASDPINTIAEDSDTPTSNEVTIEDGIFYGNAKSGSFWDDEE